MLRQSQAKNNGWGKPMQWARLEHDGRTRFGIIAADVLRVHDGDMFAGARPSGETIPLADCRWLTPMLPSKMICLWNNFHQAALKHGLAIPAEPLTFIKSANSFNAHRQKIEQPLSYPGRVVFEGELGVVIGRRCKAVDVAQAADCIFGYTCVNDVTAIELIGRDASFAQWSRAKNFDGFGVFGPVIATQIDPLQGNLRTLLNGRERQNYPLSDMIFPPAELVSRISQDMTLLPGDLIACGTSLGVLPMQPGMTIEVIVDGIGTLSNDYGSLAS